MRLIYLCNGNLQTWKDLYIEVVPGTYVLVWNFSPKSHENYFSFWKRSVTQNQTKKDLLLCWNNVDISEYNCLVIYIPIVVHLMKV